MSTSASRNSEACRATIPISSPPIWRGRWTGALYEKAEHAHKAAVELLQKQTPVDRVRLAWQLNAQAGR